MAGSMDPGFVRSLLEIGIVQHHEQETLWQVAQRCARTVGIATAGAGAIYGAGGGTVTIPGVGTVAGAAAGALAGMVYGTVSCGMLNYAVQDELRRLAEGR